MITITDKAAQAVKRIATEQKLEGKIYLRLRVQGGGCAGFSHKLDLDEAVDEKKDSTYVINGVDVVIDKRSALYVEGVNIDYHDDLNRHGFSVINPNAKTTCGCGSSFSM